MRSGNGQIVISYTYIPADIAVEAPTGTSVSNGSGTLAFGQVVPNQIKDIACTLRNTGGADLTGIVPAISGPDASMFMLVTSPPSTLAGGSNSIFTVRFTPTSLGTKTATLSIASNDPDENPFTITLTGTGNTAPTFAGYSVSTAYETATGISLGKLLAKAADADGDALTVTAAGPASAQGGTAVLGGTILYTPPTGFSGTDTFPVTITDAHGATVIGTVTVSVGPGPNAGGQGLNLPTVTMVDGKAQLRFRAIPGTSYQIQRSIGDLNSWQDMVTLTTDSTGVLTWTDPDPPTPSAFYRVRLP